MTETEHVDESADPFGSSIGEGVWRRLAGAGLAVMLAAAGFTLWTTEILPSVMVGALVVYILGVPASWAVTRHGGALIRRHVVAAVGVGIVAATVLSLPGGLWAWPFLAVFAVGIGAPVAGLAAWSGVALPDRWVRPIAIVGVLVTAVVLPVGTWLEKQPPAPHDFVVVREPDAVRQHFGDAHALAQAIAERFEHRADAGYARTAHTTWVAVADNLGEQKLAPGRPGMRFTLDEDLPTLGESDQPVRLVTTMFEDEPGRGCVIVTSATSRAEPRACADLDLTD